MDGSNSTKYHDVLGRPFKWPNEPAHGIVVGQRYLVCDDRDYSVFDFDKFLDERGEISKWPVGHEAIYARTYKEEGFQIVELSGQRATTSPDDLRFIQELLKEVLGYITSEMTARSWPSSSAKLSLQKEFASVRLPGWLASTLTTENATAALSATGERLSTVAVSNGSLSLGPENGGALNQLKYYLENQFRTARTGERLDRIAEPSAMYAPWTLVALLLGTWFFRLEPLTLLVAAIAMTIPMVIMAVQARSTGWRLYLLRSGAVTAAALYFIALFGVAYGICALFASTGPPADRLGNSFLTATSMGLAGGVVGDALDGMALRVAHVQLLLFLGGLTTLIAKVLRIEALLRERQ